ncbi:MAG: tetratricopeptide repeat protein [Bacteroidetes bacterium]|nr:tetratricopeptide repeat protein [Bacteroidota bacterium]
MNQSRPRKNNTPGSKQKSKLPPPLPPKPSGTIGKKNFLSGTTPYLILVAAITFIVFIPSLFNGLILWDDHSYTWESPFLRQFDFAKVFSFSTFYMGNYHPLTLLWLHLEWLIFPSGNPELFGGLNPFWFHLNNILLHLVSTVLVFKVIYELLDKKDWKTPLIAALLFGIHPMHVESVAWVSELKDVLYGALFLGAILVYIRYLKNRKILFLALSFILFILSNLSKGQAVTLPVLFILIDYYKGRKLDWKAWLEKVPFLAVSIFFGILALRAQASASALGSGQVLSFASIINASYGVAVYLFKAIVPVHLSAVQPYLYEGMQFPWYFYLLPFLILGLLAFCIAAVRRSKAWLFGFLFFLIAVSVMVKLVPVGDSLINERYTYIPYIGLFFIMGHLFSILSEKKKLKTALWSVLIIFFLILTVTTIQRISTWKDTGTFWNDVIHKYPEYWRGYYGMGVLSYNTSELDQAFLYADTACSKKPPAAPYMLRGALYLNHLKQPEAAVADFNKVLSFHEKGSPFEIDARLSLGQIWLAKEKYDSAIKILDEAIVLSPNALQGYMLKAKALTGLKRYPEAENEYTKALQVDPGFSDGYLSRGMLYADYLAQYEKGIADFNKVLELVPGQADARVGIGFCYYRMNNPEEAIREYDRILQTNPGEGRVYYFRALANASLNKYQEAYSDGLKALELRFNVNPAELNGWKAKAGIK